MRFSDGVLDVVGQSNRSVTWNALFKSGDSSIVWRGSKKKKRPKESGKIKENIKRTVFYGKYYNLANFATFCLKRVIDSLILQGRGVLFYKSRLQLNYVPVHETHSAKVRKIITKSKTPMLNCIVYWVSTKLFQNDCLFLRP